MAKKVVCRGGLRNVTILLDRDGNVIAEYQKIHLSEFERNVLKMIPGNVPQAKSFGQPAAPARAIIEDNRRPEIYRTAKVLL